jgi:hypothetical protein
MKRIFIPLFFLLCIDISFAQTDSSLHPLTYMEMALGDSVKKWLDIRVANAKNGIKETVQVPFVVRTLAWGCMCPDNYIGVSPNLGDGPWVFPLASKKFPKSDTIGYSLIVTGYFTGRMKTIDLRNKEGEPPEWLYVIPEFKVLSWVENKKEYDVEAPHLIKK